MTPKPEETNDNKEQGEIKVKKRKPLLLIIVIFILVLILGGLAFFFFGDSLPFISERNGTEAVVDDSPPDHIYQMSEFQVNLADPGTRRFLRVTMDFAYDDRALTREIEERESEVRSHIISILRSKFVEDLEEPGGMKALEEDIIERLNSVLDSGEIKAIYYKEFIFQ